MPEWPIDLTLWLFNLQCNGAAHHEKTPFKVGSCHCRFSFRPRIHLFYVLNLHLFLLNIVTSLLPFLHFLFLSFPCQVLVIFRFCFGCGGSQRYLSAIVPTSNELHYQ